MDSPNAYFNKQQERLNKENQGFNVGRKAGERPSTAVQMWRPKNPFLTYEKPFPTKAMLKDFTQKRLHAKVMNERVQVYN